MQEKAFQRQVESFIQREDVPAEVKEGEMAGYLFAPAEKVSEEFNGGFSLYADPAVLG